MVRRHMNRSDVFEALELEPLNSGVCGANWIGYPSGGEIVSLNPATGAELGRVAAAGADDYDRVVSESIAVFQKWRLVPAPKRGQIVREIGDELRRWKTEQ